MASVSNSQPGDAKTFVEIFPPFLMAGIGKTVLGEKKITITTLEMFHLLLVRHALCWRLARQRQGLGCVQSNSRVVHPCPGIAGFEGKHCY